MVRAGPGLRAGRRYGWGDGRTAVGVGLSRVGEGAGAGRGAGWRPISPSGQPLGATAQGSRVSLSRASRVFGP